MLDISEAEVLDRLLTLQDKGVIIPVSIQTILQRQGMGLANGEFLSEMTPVDLPKEEEPAIEKPEAPVEEPEPVEEAPPAEKPVVEEEAPVEEEQKEELDPMEEFVKDVEDLLTKEKDDDSKE
jgi:hypothetical protein